MKPYFPMFVNLEDKKILVVGAGKIATRRIKALRDFGCNITVVAPKISEEVEGMKDITLVKRDFCRSDLDGMDIAVIATNDAELNESIGKECRERGIIRNISTNQKSCDFFFPATVITDDFVIGITSGGADPGKTKMIRKRIQEFMKEEIENE